MLDGIFADLSVIQNKARLWFEWDFQKMPPRDNHNLCNNLLAGGKLILTVHITTWVFERIWDLKEQWNSHFPKRLCSPQYKEEWRWIIVYKKVANTASSSQRNKWASYFHFFSSDFNPSEAYSLQYLIIWIKMFIIFRYIFKNCHKPNWKSSEIQNRWLAKIKL